MGKRLVNHLLYALREALPSRPFTFYRCNNCQNLFYLPAGPAPACSRCGDGATLTALSGPPPLFNRFLFTYCTHCGLLHTNPTQPYCSRFACNRAPLVILPEHVCQ